jgi:hypothetical protein
MALSAADLKRQKEAAARASKNKKDAQARAEALRAKTRERMRAEANKKANDERARLTSRADIQSAWGGGKATKDKLKNDLSYVESQRVKTQNAIGGNKPQPKPAAKPQAKAPNNGDTTIKEGNKFVFNNGQWRLAKEQGGGSTTRAAAVTSGSSGGSQGSASATPPASRPTNSDNRPGQTGDKEKDLAAWRAANPKLAEALDKRNKERGTSKTTNPLMKDFLEGMRKREDVAQARQDADNATPKPKNFNTPDEKSKYVAPNGQPYAGPAFGNGATPLPEEKPSPTPTNSKTYKLKATETEKNTKDNYNSSSITDSRVKLPESQSNKAKSLGDNSKTAYSLYEELKKKKASA